MTAVDLRAEVLSALDRAGKELEACALDACAGAVDALRLSMIAGAEPPREQVAQEHIAPDASLELLVANRAALDSAVSCMDEAWRMVGRGLLQFPFAVALIARYEAVRPDLE